MDKTEENETPPNPYAASAEVVDDDIDLVTSRVDENPEDDFPSFAYVVVRWTLICGISAIPSFTLGVLLEIGRTLGMLTGIVLFIAGYVWIDLSSRKQVWRRNRNVRVTMRIIYGLRLFISIVFPIGMMADLFFGLLAASFVQFTMGAFIFRNDPNESFVMGFFGSMFTTIIQGALLNAVMLVVAFCIYPLVALESRSKRRIALNREAALKADAIGAGGETSARLRG